MSDGRFKPGQSGNPAGRKPGVRNKSNVVAAEFAKEGSEIARVVIEKAKEGDMSAASLVLQRLSPPLRPAAEKVTFALDPDAPVADQAKQILLAVSQGEIDPDTGKMLLDCLSAYIGMKDVETFLSELRKLREAKTGVPGGVMTT